MATRIQNQFAEFYITNGTDRVDLLGAGKDGGDGIKIEKSRFRRPERDAESIFNLEYKPIQESYSLLVAGNTQDIAIAYIRALDKLLIQAENYFMNNFETTLVWMCSRAVNETNPRYAVVYLGNIPEYSDIYNQPFVSVDGKAILDDLTLNIQHGVWLENPPLTPASQTLAVTSVATSAAYIGNRFTELMIKSVKVFDNSPSGYTTYTTTGALNYPTGVSLLPAAPAASDALYIGFNPKSAGTVSLPDSVYINILVGKAQTIVGEYWSGAAWTALPQFVDNTAGLTVAGTVSWGQGFNDWATSTVDTVSANWIRLRVTASPSGQAPTANNIHAPRCFVEFSDIGGDIPALVDLEFTNVCDPGGAYQSELRRHTSSIYFGLRSVSRGATFIPWVNPTLSALAPVPSGNTDTYNYAPVGRLVTFYKGNGSYLPAVNYNFIGRVVDGVTTVVQDYVGSFRLLVRLNTTDYRDQPVLRLVLKTQADDVSKGFPYSPMLWTGPSIYPTWTNPISNIPSIIDFGQITLGHRDLASLAEVGGTPYFQLQSYQTAGAIPDLAYELFMLPVDEFSGFVEDPNYNNPLTVGLRLALQSASYHRRRVRSVQKAASPSELVAGSWRSSTSGSMVVQPSTGAQRLYFISETWNDRRMTAPTNMVHKVTMKVTERYLGLRGK